MNAFADILLERIRQEYQHAEPRWSYKRAWKDIPLPMRKWIQQECASDSEFDALHLRKNTLFRHEELTYATCPYGTVVALYDKNIHEHDVPWGLWGRILRLFSRTNTAERGKSPFTIYFLANEMTRRFPSGHAPILPQHINGGYTYPCKKDTIVIYRAEDATRVLLHELQHACCLDRHADGIDCVEAATEAWAELLYAAVLSKGVRSAWEEEKRRQWRWMVAQNHCVRRHLATPMAFPWRYTIGKEEKWRKWFPEWTLRVSIPSACTSLRLTPPPTPQHCHAHQVPASSMIL